VAELDRDGFGNNTGRGTGHFFSALALDAFLRRYSFSHLVSPSARGTSPAPRAAFARRPAPSTTLDRWRRVTRQVRAHEVRKTGFQVQQHAKMVTLFSSSGYCGSNNEARPSTPGRPYWRPSAPPVSAPVPGNAWRNVAGIVLW